MTFIKNAPPITGRGDKGWPAGQMQGPWIVPKRCNVACLHQGGPGEGNPDFFVLCHNKRHALTWVMNTFGVSNLISNHILMAGIPIAGYSYFLIFKKILYFNTLYTDIYSV